MVNVEACFIGSGQDDTLDVQNKLLRLIFTSVFYNGIFSIEVFF